MAQTSLRQRAEDHSHAVNSRTVQARDIQVFQFNSAGGAATPGAVVPGLGNVVSTFVDVGPNSTRDLLLTITGLNLTTDAPATVLLQPRQNANQNFGFPDQFNVMLITTARSQMLVRIERADANGGWGQDLRLDILIMDRVNNP
jgi:hypothetical protein